MNALLFESVNRFYTCRWWWHCIALNIRIPILMSRLLLTQFEFVSICLSDCCRVNGMGIHAVLYVCKYERMRLSHLFGPPGFFSSSFPNCSNDKLLFSYCAYYSFQPHSSCAVQVTCIGKCSYTFREESDLNRLFARTCRHIYVQKHTCTPILLCNSAYSFIHSLSHLLKKRKKLAQTEEKCIWKKNNERLESVYDLNVIFSNFCAQFQFILQKFLSFSSINTFNCICDSFVLFWNVEMNFFLIEIFDGCFFEMIFQTTLDYIETTNNVLHIAYKVRNLSNENAVKPVCELIVELLNWK